MTPMHYSRQKLESILGLNKYRLYHCTEHAAAMEIINDGYLLSKAALMGRHFRVPSRFAHIKPLDAESDAENGFMDYVFFNNTDWTEEGLPAKYGEVTFIVRPEAILSAREFFVFPFNTGWYFGAHSDEEKLSDTTTLLSALNVATRRYEVLVRRRVEIDAGSIHAIRCAQDKVESIVGALNEKGISDVQVIPYSSSGSSEKPSITLDCPLPGGKVSLRYEGADYIRQDDAIYLKADFSNCIFWLQVKNENELFDPYTKKRVGKIDAEAHASHF